MLKLLSKRTYDYNYGFLLGSVLPYKLLEKYLYNVFKNDFLSITIMHSINYFMFETKSIRYFSTLYYISFKSMQQMLIFYEWQKKNSIFNNKEWAIYGAVILINFFSLKKFEKQFSILKLPIFFPFLFIPLLNLLSNFYNNWFMFIYRNLIIKNNANVDSIAK